MSTDESSDPRAPASREASLGRDVLEGALRKLAELPAEVAREPLARALQDALGRLGALETRSLLEPDHLQQLVAADGAVRAAAQLLASVHHGPVAQRLARNVEVVAESLGRCREESIERIVVLQQQMTAAADPLVPPLRRPFRASQGTPGLHQLDRDGPVEPLVRVQADKKAVIRPDDEISRLRAEVERKLATGVAPEQAEPAPESEPERQPEPTDEPNEPAAERPPAAGAARALDVQTPGEAGEHAQLRRLARKGLEQIGILGNLRRTTADQLWHEGIAAIEQRLLDHLDAVIALGRAPAGAATFDLMGEVQRHCHSPFAADPFRAFARAFVLCCVEGADTVRAAVLGMLQSWPEEMRAQQEALALAPNPAIDESLSRLAQEPTTELQRMALELMARRRRIDMGAVVLSLPHPDDVVRAAALSCLGLCEEREAALELLYSALPAELEDTVAAELLRSLLLLDLPGALGQLRQRVREEQQEPGTLDRRGYRVMLRLLAVAGAKSDADLLVRGFTTEPSVADALGAHGHPALLEPLLAALEPRLEPDADARARRRDNRRRYAAARALHRITGADLPDDPKASYAYLPTAEAEPWRRWLAEHRDSFTEEQRYRLGAPYTVEGALDELSSYGVPADLREADAFEIGLALRQPPLDVHDWSVRQQSELGVLRSRLEQCRGAAGARIAAGGAVRLPATGQWLGDRYDDAPPAS